MTQEEYENAEALAEMQEEFKPKPKSARARVRTVEEVEQHLEDDRKFQIQDSAQIMLQLVSNKELFVKFFPLMNKEMFEEKTDILLFRDISDHYNLHKLIPNISEINQLVKESGFGHRFNPVTEYWSTEFLDETMRQSIEYASMRVAMEDSLEMLDDQNYGGIYERMKEALDIDFNDSLGVSAYDIDDIFEDITSSKKYLPTGWATLDDMLGGGVQIPSLNYFIAKSGGGKSVTLINIAYNTIKQGRDVIYVSLELSGNEIMNRFYTHMMKQTTKQFTKQGIKDKLINNVEKGYGEFVSIFKQPGSLSSLELETLVRKYINTHDGRVPLIIVDYAGLMKANNFHPQMAAFEKDKAISEELRGVATMFDTVVWTVEQFNRTGLGDKEANEVSEENIQGGISKLQTCDNMFAMIPSSAQRDVNIIQCKVFKARNAPIAGKYFQFMVDWDSLTFKDYQGQREQNDIVILKDKPKPKRDRKKPSGASLKNLRRL